MSRHVIGYLKNLPFAIVMCAVLCGAQAQTTPTGITGGNQPFSNLQPSLAVTMAVPLQGIFPSRGGSGTATGGTLGFVYAFAGNYQPNGSPFAAGQLLPISQNTAVFSLLGTQYGGDGRTTFALPDLQGRAILGAGNGPGLSVQDIGVPTGSNTVSLATAQLPIHSHSLLGGGVTGTAGGNQPFNNMQLSLPLTRLIAIEGIFPSQGGGSGSASFIGQIATFAGNFVPDGWAAADGALIPIAQNEALFAILGTQYGGDGITTFALPDLRGRVSVGVDSTHPQGLIFGEESTVLTASQLAAHNHTLPSGGVTGVTGASQPVNNDQPSLALNYLIALQGIFPSNGGNGGFDSTTPFLGQITEFAGNFAPSGWALANGQLLPISQNQALFAILGTQYGGDGRTTFALPDFRGRTLIGSDSSSNFVGSSTGTHTNTLTVANLAAHNHTLGAVSHDFNRDGKSDVLWLHAPDVTAFEWQMNGTAIGVAGSPASVGDPNWQVVGVGDFDGDGKADVLWKNSVSGTVLMWLMNGTTIASTGSPATVGGSSAGWVVVGVGDFDGDGKADILWQNTISGTLFVWLMNGTSIASTGSPATVDSIWQVKGVGDFDGDGKADILWQNTSGTVFVWLMNGTAIASTGSPASVPAGWSIQGVGDFDGNGKADIVWLNTSSFTVLVWLMNGTAISTTGSPATVDATWQIKGTGDYNGDSKADLLWKNTVSGNVFVWLMNGTAISTTGSPATVTDTAWQVQNPK